MTNEITPPRELVEQWEEQWCDMPVIRPSINSYMATQAARWGADTELEACLDQIYKGVGLRLIPYGSHRELLCSDLRAARRPEPPSLKEQALELARAAGTDGAYVTFGPEELTLIRRALEALDD